MASVDIAGIISGALEPLAGDPCGPNLEYDAQFVALERDAVGKAEQQIGSTIVKAEDPDWAVVEREARALLARTKDLRVALQLTRALVRTEGWAGFAAGLAVVGGLVEQQWDGVHPQLDPDDDNDPTARLNILAGLADSPTIAGVRAMPLVSSRLAGRFGMREIEIASGEAAAAPDEASPPTMSVIDGALGEVDLPTLEATAHAVSASLKALVALEAAVSEKAAGQTLALTRLAALVRKAHAFIAGRVAERNPASAEAVATDGAVGSAPSRVSGEISSREDVLRALDRIVAYYARHEPSSPIPMLIERSKKLVAMSFVDIIRELAPDGVSQIETLRGRTD